MSLITLILILVFGWIIAKTIILIGYVVIDLRDDTGQRSSFIRSAEVERGKDELKKELEERKRKSISL